MPLIVLLYASRCILVTSQKPEVSIQKTANRGARGRQRIHGCTDPHFLALRAGATAASAFPSLYTKDFALGYFFVHDIWIFNSVSLVMH